MKISFKEIDKGLENEVYVDDTYIGSVSLNIWNGKWEIKPYFNHYTSMKLIKKIKYDSFYKAGKALVKLYSDTFIFEEENTDTQPIDMRGIWGGSRRRP